MKRINDFFPFTNILPYSSEIFGVYQPLLGWRSKRIRDRIRRGARNDTNRLFDSIYAKHKARFKLAINNDGILQRIESVEPASLGDGLRGPQGTYIFDSINQNLPPLSDYNDSIWNDLIQSESLNLTLKRIVVPKCMNWYRRNWENYKRSNRAGREDLASKMVADQLNKESALAGYLLYLKENKHFDKLKESFYQFRNISGILAYLKYQDPLDTIDPLKDIDRVALSPIGIVHLFRQYFFEFDTFLGPPVSHVWLSPGATVELFEISTRKIVTEKTIESAFETIGKTEKSLAQQDDLSDAVKDDNKSDIRFGVNTTANQSWIGGSASASASLNMGSSQNKAREITHKQMRQQTEKLSTEIRTNFKSTFKTTTETTDTSSKRYVLSNSTSELINYELRRKMRQVGVQVQDIGTYLCWQTYVDDPGKYLGISKMVHLAKSPEVGDTPPPESIPNPPPLVTPMDIQIPFSPESEDAELDDDDTYVWGQEQYAEGAGEDELEKINYIFPANAICEQPGYEYAAGEGDIDFDYRGNDIELSLLEDPVEDTPGHITFKISVDSVNFHGVTPLIVGAKVHWRPTKATLDDIAAKNKEKQTDFNEKTKLAFIRSFVDAARERIKKSSNIEPRKFEDLRDEERIVVYRHLIQQMLTKNIPMPDEKTHHVVSELLNTIFDIDKMLYFVAPEWWRPRLHESHQSLGSVHAVPTGTVEGTVHMISEGGAQYPISDVIVEPPPTPANMEDKQIASTDIVSWGGAGRADNYYITEESAPAKLGSSLGWLIQLDADNLRNAFLNAPWVKAVIPIRPGKERAAINWLQGVEVEGTEGLSDDYVAPSGELSQIPHSGPKVTISDAINHLCDIVAKKHEDSLKVNKYPKEEINDDNKVDVTPIDRVYEHGFYPLQGGFKAKSGPDQFEVFDQWVEILPTDQIVPVEVRYDPKTGRQL
jgi:hypothetical protein